MSDTSIIHMDNYYKQNKEYIKQKTVKMKTLKMFSKITLN